MAVVSSVYLWLLSVKGAGTKGFSHCVWSKDQDKEKKTSERE